MPNINCKRSSGAIIPAKVLFQSRLNYYEPEFPAHLSMALKNTLAISQFKSGARFASTNGCRF